MLEQNDKKCVTVFTQKLATYLMQNGHKLIELKPDKKYPERNVYFFLNTESVRNDMAQYTTRAKNRKLRGQKNGESKNNNGISSNRREKVSWSVYHG